MKGVRVRLHGDEGAKIRHWRKEIRPSEITAVHFKTVLTWSHTSDPIKCLCSFCLNQNCSFQLQLSAFNGTFLLKEQGFKPQATVLTVPPPLVLKHALNLNWLQFFSSGHHCSSGTYTLASWALAMWTFAEINIKKKLRNPAMGVVLITRHNWEIIGWVLAEGVAWSLVWKWSASSWRRDVVWLCT